MLLQPVGPGEAEDQQTRTRGTSDLLEALLRRIQLGSDPKEIKADLVCQRGVQSAERLVLSLVFQRTHISRIYDFFQSI